MSAPPEGIAATLGDPLEPAVATRLWIAADENVVARIWERDETLWGGPGPEIGNRLGWLTIADRMLAEVDGLRAFAAQVREAGFTHAALLGMGGSSLGPEVLRRSFGKLDGGLALEVLDSTDPGAVRALERGLDLDRTLFVVSSKSGGTVETLSHMRYFLDRTGGNGDQFVAVTDPASPLAELAERHGFRRLFESEPDIGGRYSVLSFFGLVPAVLAGVDIEALLRSAQTAAAECRAQSRANPGLWLGAALGEAAAARRDKATFVVAEPIESFGLWVEQLIAESTGKLGKGILPVAGEPLGPPEVYGDDRVFVWLGDRDEPAKGALRTAGQPVISIASAGPADLGGLLFLFEFAVAVAGWVLGINPFDQPNVQEAKDNTARALSEPDPPRVEPAAAAALEDLIGHARPPRYVAVMAYVEPSGEFDDAVADLRRAVRDPTRAATTFGYGPRFLHSTGQYHKGGPPDGLFLQLTSEYGERGIPVPGENYTFAELIAAQATGDLRTLRDHGLTAERVVLAGEPAVAVRALTEQLRELLAG